MLKGWHVIAAQQETLSLPKHPEHPQNLDVPYLSLLPFIHLIYACSKVQLQMPPFCLVTFPSDIT